MSSPRVVADRSKVTGLAIGAIAGALLGIGTSFYFLLILFGPLVGLGLAIIGMRGGFSARSISSVGGGLLIGAGSVYLLGALNTLYSCQGPDACGGANPLPLLGYALAILGGGLLVAGVTMTQNE
jgi:hypothetical protein